MAETTLRLILASAVTFAAVGCGSPATTTASQSGSAQDTTHAAMSGSGGTPHKPSTDAAAGRAGSTTSGAGPKSSAGNTSSTLSAGAGTPAPNDRAGSAGPAAAGGSPSTSTNAGASAPTTTGDAGSAATPSAAPVASDGCNAASTAKPCSTSGSPCTMDIDGTQREYYVVLPDSYDAKRPYPVVFQFHPLGGNAEQGMNMYRIRPNFPDAIYVTPNGLISGNNRGFPNTKGQDEAMTRAIMADIEAKYCVDKARYFSTGFSYGGSMSYTAACNMSDVFRAIGAMSGAPISGARCSSEQPKRPVAFWGTHGTADNVLAMNLALPIRDAFVKRNGCSMTTHPVDPSPCVEYDGCSAGYPLVWCPVEGEGHAIPAFSSKAISAFLKQF